MKFLQHLSLLSAGLLCLLFNLPLLSSTRSTKLVNGGERAARICGVTALFGNYERTLKQPALPQTYSMWKLFAFTDRYDLEAGAWTLIHIKDTPLQSKSLCEKTKEYVNSPCENTNPMNLGKYFKMQFHKIQVVQKSCDVVCWMDATLSVKLNRFFEVIATRTGRGENLLVFEHSRDGLVDAEVNASLGVGRYDTEFAYGHPQPFQDVHQQYVDYVAEGFKERWWIMNEKDHNIVRSKQYGLWVTCFIVFNIRLRETRSFLDLWWHENLRHTTQDQVSFPYVVWKTGLMPHSLPDAELKGDIFSNELYVRLEHGNR